ncbi:MAG: thermonuclease family protein [Caldisericia bacterium]|nr:thermonuclease family protein [Caldisericia bacterium]MDD4614140.1 thermonuclease family protein [Caldisericia bacterium]
MRRSFLYILYAVILFLSFSLFSCATSSRYVTDVVDGDTIVVNDGTRIRYIGINTPEKGQRYYSEAKERNRQLVQGKTIYLEFDESQFDSFGRTLAYVYTEEGFVNELIVKSGLAMEFYRSPNGKYRKLLKRAEEEAKKQGLYLFKPSPYQSSLAIHDFHYDAEGDDNDNVNGEWVVIGNVSTKPIHLAGFYFYDESFHQYTFPEIVLDPGKNIKIFTGVGEDTDQFLYAKFSEPIWNNSGDTLFVYDFLDRLVLEESY